MTMQFIVEWLRRGVCGENMGCAPRACACALMEDAADHIELLQDEIRQLRAGQKGGKDE